MSTAMRNFASCKGQADSPTARGVMNATKGPLLAC
jgi:hypothetical protein